jgi:uncharacterized membrane protein
MLLPMILLSTLLIPLIMFGFGTWFEKHPPKKINYYFGYRTERSMKNRETWGFAHRTVGRLWKRFGLILLACGGAAACLITAFAGADTAGPWCLGVEFAELAALIVSIFPVEAALKKNFDEHGMRKS